MSNSSIKTEMKGTTSRWMRRADAKDLSRVQRRINDTSAVLEGVEEEMTKEPKEKLIYFEVNYTDRVTGGKEAGGIIASETGVGAELKAEVNWLLDHADLSKPWSFVGKKA